MEGRNRGRGPHPHGAILRACGNAMSIMTELQQQDIIHMAPKPAGLLRLRPVASFHVDCCRRCQVLGSILL